MTDIPELALARLKAIWEVDEMVSRWATETVGEQIDSVDELYRSESAIPEADNDIELGSLEIKEPEYNELIGLIETAREAAADDPQLLGIRNRLLMQIILANPEEYSRVTEEKAERKREEQLKELRKGTVRDRIGEIVGLGDASEIPIDDRGGI